MGLFGAIAKELVFAAGNQLVLDLYNEGEVREYIEMPSGEIFIREYNNHDLRIQSILDARSDRNTGNSSYDGPELDDVLSYDDSGLDLDIGHFIENTEVVEVVEQVVDVQNVDVDHGAATVFADVHVDVAPVDVDVV